MLTGSPLINKLLVDIQNCKGLTDKQKEKVSASILSDYQQPVTKISVIGDPSTGKTTETIFTGNAKVLFIKSFWEWQKRFRCPNCNKPTLDFVTSEKIIKPIICTSCKHTFGFGVA